MDFLEIANARQSCRSYDETRAVEHEKLEKVLEAVRLSPSACNGQPYTHTVCTGEKAKEVALLTRGMGGMNKFAVQAPVCIVISEAPYNRTAALGAKVKGNEFLQSILEKHPTVIDYSVIELGEVNLASEGYSKLRLQ